MKKILTLCAGLLLVFSLSACNDNSGDLPGPGEEEPEPEVTEPGAETGGDGDDGGEIGGEEEPNPSDPSSELLNFESVSFVDSPYILEVGATRTTQLEVKPEGIDVSVTYTAKDALIASIDTDGVITGIGEGETEVYATVSAEGYNDAIATAIVQVEAQYVETDYVKSITFLESNGYTLKVGDTYDFTSANGVYVDVSGSASQEFTLECDTDGYTDYFTISNTSITALQVTEDPITLKAIATGDTTKTAETTITITGEEEVKVTGITVNEKAADSSSVKWGGSYSATIAVTPANASNTNYVVTSDQVSDSELFTVEKGEGGACTFTHKSEHAGTEVFTITPADGSSVSCTLTLTAEKEIIEPGTPYFEGLAGTYEITDTLYDLDSYLNLDWQVDEDDDHTHDTVSVSYTSSDTGVVSISGSTASIVGTGEATITATISGENLAQDLETTADITVIWTATEMNIDHETLTLTEEEEETLSVTFGPTGYTIAPTVNWAIESGGDSYVSISETTGNSITVTAVSAGSATITASAEGCTSVSCTVTVEAKAVYESTTFTITINGSNGTAFPEAPEGVSIYLGTDCFDTTWQYYAMTYTSNSVYTYTTTATPIAGSHYVSIYAYNGSGNIYDHEIGSGYQFTITGTETGEVSIAHTYQISYLSWDDIFPTHTGSTSFYILAFDTTGTSSNFSSLGNLESESEYFSGSKDVTATTGTAPSGQNYVYNSVAGVASADNRTSWFTFSESSSNWDIQCPCGTLEIPDNNDGYAVYVCVNDGEHCVSGGYTAWVPSSGVPNGVTLTNGWATGVTSITEFINTIQPTGATKLS